MSQTDPAGWDVGEKAGNEEASVKMQVVIDCEETKSASIGAAKKKPLFSKLPKISLEKITAAKTNDNKENKVVEQETKKNDDATP